MRKKWTYISHNTVLLMQKMGSTWWINWEGTRRADYLFSSQSFVLSSSFSFPLLVAVCLLGNHYSDCRSQTSETEKRGKCFPSQREKMWWGNENKSICVCGHKFNPHSKRRCTDEELWRVQPPQSAEPPIIPVPKLRSSRKMNHFHVSAHHTFSQLICKSPMSSFPFLCSGCEPKKRERFPFSIGALRLIHGVRTHTVVFGLSMFQWPKMQSRLL